MLFFKLALVYIVCTCLVEGTYLRPWWRFFEKACNPPEKIVGKFCATVLDDDVDDDGILVPANFIAALIPYNSDDKLCRIERQEALDYTRCRYGWSDSYNGFTFDFLDRNKDGAYTAEDFANTRNFTRQEFLMVQYEAFKNYCSSKDNRQDPLDKVHCEELDTLTTDEIQCPFL